MDLLNDQAEFAHNVARLIQYIFMQGYICTLGDAYRTPEQAELYAKEGKGIVDSLHCKRLAIDLNLFTHDGRYLSDTKDYEPIGKYWELLHQNNRWGGRFERKDGNHFERQEK
ncbi:MAG TPA: M15 family metallopeptidase [Candidatus Babeliales bacterium]|nr:M15 family metallopeptidase [Candidatus Babeliales bacterium]